MPRPSRRCSMPIKANRLPQAFIIGGQAGIGKATLAWRLARFLLAHPDPTAAAVQRRKISALRPTIRWRARSPRSRMAMSSCCGANGTRSRSAISPKSAPTTCARPFICSSRRQRRAAIASASSTAPRNSTIRRQCAVEAYRGAAAALAVPHRRASAGAGFADDALALPDADFCGRYRTAEILGVIDAARRALDRCGARARAASRPSGRRLRRDRAAPARRGRPRTRPATSDGCLPICRALDWRAVHALADQVDGRDRTAPIATG